MKFYLLSLFIILFAAPVMAQGKNAAMPNIPEALIPLEEKGAQLRYLGTQNGMDGWIAIYQGQEQYYYITPDKKAFVTGLMFAQDGRPITIEQVKDLQSQNGGVLDLLAADQKPEEKLEKLSDVKSVTEGLSVKTPAEKMFTDVENSNWIKIGDDTAPIIYSFVDPQCPHCHEFLTDIRKKYIDTGVVQVRIIPVGFQEGSLAQASFLLGAPNGEELFLRHLDGDKDALPAKSDMSTQAVQKNMALMQAWKFNVTPLTAYRSKDGEIKIIRGRAKDAAGMIADLPAGAPKS
jgi:thiol:disulfide interchange protein DsbG